MNIGTKVRMLFAVLGLSSGCVPSNYVRIDATGDQRGVFLDMDGNGCNDFVNYQAPPDDVFRARVMYGNCPAGSNTPNGFRLPGYDLRVSIPSTDGTNVVFAEGGRYLVIATRANDYLTVTAQPLKSAKGGAAKVAAGKVEYDAPRTLVGNLQLSK